MLDLSQTSLKESGYEYLNLDEFRKKYTRPILYGGNHGSPHSPSGVNFIFDENIPNLVQHVLSRDGLYPNLADRSTKLASYFGFVKPHVFFGIRDYATFLPSLFCETLKSTSYKPFSEFYDPSINQLDWNDVIDRLRGAFPESEISIYAYESLRGNECTLLERVTGIPSGSFRLPKGKSRLGFSHEAVKSLHQLSKSRTVTFEDVFEAVRTFPKGKKWSSFNPFNADRVGELNTLYNEHLQCISSRADINFIDLRSEAAPRQSSENQ